jgi:hypothetical protein
MYSHGRTGARTRVPGKRLSIFRLGLALLATALGVLLASSHAFAANIVLRTLVYNQAYTTLLYSSSTSSPKLTLQVPSDVTPGQVLTIVVALDTAGQTWNGGYNISIDLDSGIAGGGDNELTYVSGSAVQMAVRNSNGSVHSFTTSPQTGFTDATPRTATAAISPSVGQQPSRGGTTPGTGTDAIALFRFQVTVGAQSTITSADSDIAGNFDLRFTPVSFGSSFNTVQGNTLVTTPTGVQLVPEPSTLLLTGMGVLGLALAGKRARSPRGREPKEGNEAK